MSSNINNNSILNSGHNWEDLCLQLIYQQTCTSNNQGWSDFQSNFSTCFNIDLLMQHEFLLCDSTR